jgi:hypothetical protein
VSKALASTCGSPAATDGCAITFRVTGDAAIVSTKTMP